jgi:hypothetical protein
MVAAGEVAYLPYEFGDQATGWLQVSAVSDDDVELLPVWSTREGWAFSPSSFAEEAGRIGRTTPVWKNLAPQRMTRQELLGGKKPTQSATAHGVCGQFDTSGGVDDDGCHASPRARSSVKVSIARTAGEVASLAWWRSSQARKVSAVTSSSGLVTTTAGSLGRSSALRATPPS